MKKKGEGYTPAEKAVFEGVDWRPILKAMKIAYQDEDQSTYMGVTALDRIVQEYHPKHLMWENMLESDFWKYYYYARSMGDNWQALIWFQRLAMLTPASIGEYTESITKLDVIPEPLITRAKGIAHSLSTAIPGADPRERKALLDLVEEGEKEYQELLKAAKGLTDRVFPYADSAQRYQILRAAFLVALNANIPHVNAPHVTYKRKPGEIGAKWSQVALTPEGFKRTYGEGAEARLELLRHRIGLRTEAATGNEYIVFPGCDIVYETETVARGSFPNGEQYGTRWWSKLQLEQFCIKILQDGSLGDAFESERIWNHLSALTNVHGLPNLPPLTQEELTAQGREAVRG